MENLAEIESRIGRIESAIERIEERLDILEEHRLEFHDLRVGHVRTDVDGFCTFVGCELMRLDYRIDCILEEERFKEEPLGDVDDYGTPEEIRAREAEFEKFSREFKIDRRFDMDVGTILCRWGVTKPETEYRNLKFDHVRNYLNKRGEEIITYHPYLGNEEEVKTISDRLAEFCRKYCLHYNLYRDSWYNPGKTYAVVLWRDHCIDSFVPKCR